MENHTCSCNKKFWNSMIRAWNGACQKLTWRSILLTWKIEALRISVLFNRNYLTKYLTFCYLKSFKLYGPHLWIEFNCIEATEPLWGGSLLITTQFPEIPGTGLIGKRLKDEKLSQPWIHPVVLKTATLRTQHLNHEDIAQLLVSLFISSS